MLSLVRASVGCADENGAADVSLAQKLAEELQYEKEAAAPAEPDFLKAFKAQGVWQVRLCCADSPSRRTRSTRLLLPSGSTRTTPT